MPLRAFVLAAGLLALPSCGAPSEPPAPPAPHFELEDTRGERLSLDDLRGRTVVIDFWATWCLPCVFQPAELNKLLAAHEAGGKLAVLGIEVGGASAEEVLAWGRENEAVAEYPLLIGADDALARDYGIHGFPATAIVSPEGRIDSIHVGLIDAAELEREIAHLIQ